MFKNRHSKTLSYVRERSRGIFNKKTESKNKEFTKFIVFYFHKITIKIFTVEKHS